MVALKTYSTDSIVYIVIKKTAVLWAVIKSVIVHFMGVLNQLWGVQFITKNIHSS